MIIFGFEDTSLIFFACLNEPCLTSFISNL